MLKISDIQKIQNFIDLLESKGINFNKDSFIDAFYFNKPIFIYNIINEVILTALNENDILYANSGVGYALENNKLYKVIYSQHDPSFEPLFVKIDFENTNGLFIKDHYYENKGFTNMLNMLIDYAYCIKNNFNYLLYSGYKIKIKTSDIAISFTDYNFIVNYYYDNSAEDSLDIKLYDKIICFEYKNNKQRIYLMSPSMYKLFKPENEYIFIII